MIEKVFDVHPSRFDEFKYFMEGLGGIFINIVELKLHGMIQVTISNPPAVYREMIHKNKCWGITIEEEKRWKYLKNLKIILCSKFILN
jgi:hypothetical protein